MTQDSHEARWRRRLEGARDRLATDPHELVARVRRWHRDRDLDGATTSLPVALEAALRAVLTEDRPEADANGDLVTVAVAEAIAQELAAGRAELDVFDAAGAYITGPGGPHFLESFAGLVRAQPGGAWRAVLEAPPLDPMRWLRPWDQRSGNADGLADEAAHNVPRPPAALLHDGMPLRGLSRAAERQLALLQQIDPRAALEFAAGLPWNALAFGACDELTLPPLDSLPSLVADVSTVASGLLLGRITRHVEMPPLEPGTDLSALFASVAAVLLSRPDGDRLLGPWLYYLAERRQRAAARSRDGAQGVTWTALHAAAAVIGERGAQVDLGTVPSTADRLLVEALILLARPDDRGGAAAVWQRWIDLLGTSDESFRFADDADWWHAGAMLARCDDPLATWTAAVRRLQPALRAYERDVSSRIDLVPSLVMAAVWAAEHLGTSGHALWNAASRLANRHYLVVGLHDLPGAISLELPAFPFRSFRAVFGEDEPALGAALATLPDDDLVRRAQTLVDPEPPEP